MKDFNKAIDLICRAIISNQKITVFGDYDVDGISSTVILCKMLYKLGADVDYILPSRINDGFGLNKKIIDDVYDRKTQLLITCDNGIAAIDEINYARSLDIKVVIIDHHEPNTKNNIDILPNANAIVDNKQKDCSYKFKYLCAAGMCYKIAKALLDKSNLNEKESLLDDILIFAGIATLCDVVSLTDENRIIASKAIELINVNRLSNIGLRTLLQQNKLQNETITSSDVYFKIGPCINACGRLETADIAVELFLTNDIQCAQSLACKIIEINKNRKTFTQEACEKIFLELQDYDFNKNPVLVLYKPNIIEGIAGIIAGKIRETFLHPVVLLVDGENCVKGSCRSIEHYDMFDELQCCRDLFIKFGGHSMAAGFSMHKENIKLLRERLNRNCCLQTEDFKNEIKIDYELKFSEIDYNLMQEIFYLEPFGCDNSEPTFITKNVYVKDMRVISNKDTIIFELYNDKQLIKGICFGLTNRFEKLLLHENKFTDDNIKEIDYVDNSNLILDIVYSIELNNFRGQTSLQLRIKDFVISNIK
jgi:single-stranded-DNA-specific exonuclease